MVIIFYKRSPLFPAARLLIVVKSLLGDITQRAQAPKVFQGVKNMG